MSLYRQKPFRESCFLTSGNPGGKLAAANTKLFGFSEVHSRCESQSQTNPLQWAGKCHRHGRLAAGLAELGDEVGPRRPA